MHCARVVSPKGDQLLNLTLEWWPGRSDRGQKPASKTDRIFTLSDEQWEIIADLFPWAPPVTGGGRPQGKPRSCFEGICSVLRTGCR